MNNRALAKISFYFLLTLTSANTALILFFGCSNPLLKIAGILFLAAAAANYFVLNPITISEHGDEGFSGIPMRDEKRDTLLLLSRESLLGNTHKRGFLDTDWGLSWVNTMEKEFGGCDLQYSDDFSFKTLSERRILVLAKNIAIDEEATVSIRRFIESGGVLISEMPGESTRGLLDIKSGDIARKTAEKITWVNPEYGNEPVRSALKEMPLGTFLLDARVEERDGWEAVIKIDDSPAVLKRRFGNGVMVAILFDYGLQMVSLKQGRPHCKNFRMRKFFEKGLQGLKSFHLADWHKRHVLYYPFADILERFLIDVTAKEQPVPAWWYYPRQFRNCLITSFDEDYHADGVLGLLEQPRSGKQRETLFVLADSDIKKETLDLVSKRGFDIGVHWNRFLFHLNNKGAHWNKYKKLDQQIKALEQKLPSGAKIDSCRIHFLRWDNDFANTFKVLQKNRILLDSSLGPGRDQKGYIFGTGFPYRPQDKDGKLFDMYELPFHIHEPQGSSDAVFNQRLFNDSLNLWHNCIVALFHSYYCLKGEISYANYRGLCESADPDQTWMPNFSEFVSFWNARNASRLRSAYYGKDLIVEAVAQTGGMTLCLPDTKDIEYIYLDDKLASLPDAVNGNALIAIPRGAHKVKVKYKTDNKKEGLYGKDFSYSTRV